MISFDITSGGTLGCGYKYDSGTGTIQFTGFTKENAEDMVSLAFNNGTDQLVELGEDLTLEIGSPLTDAYGEMEGQLVEMSADGKFVKNSNIFMMSVKRSIGRELPAEEEPVGDETTNGETEGGDPNDGN